MVAETRRTRFKEKRHSIEEGNDELNEPRWGRFDFGGKKKERLKI